MDIDNSEIQTLVYAPVEDADTPLGLIVLMFLMFVALGGIIVGVSWIAAQSAVFQP